MGDKRDQMHDKDLGYVHCTWATQSTLDDFPLSICGLRKRACRAAPKQLPSGEEGSQAASVLHPRRLTSGTQLSGEATQIYAQCNKQSRDYLNKNLCYSERHSFESPQVIPPFLEHGSHHFSSFYRSSRVLFPEGLVV